MRNISRERILHQSLNILSDLRIEPLIQHRGNIRRMSILYRKLLGERIGIFHRRLGLFRVEILVEFDDLLWTVLMEEFREARGQGGILEDSV